MIPATVEDITPGWLSEVLGADVDGFEATPVGEGVGLISVLYRLELSGAGPDSVIAKMTSPHPEALDLVRRYGFYEREVNFYRHLAPTVSTRVPHCHHVDMADGSIPFILLIEDLRDLRIADQVAGCSPEDAELVVKAAARLHAPYWGGDFDGMEWLPPVNNELYKGAQQQLAEMWPLFAEACRDQVSDTSFETGFAMTAQLNTLQDRMAARPEQTVSHYDLRLDNMLVDDAAGEMVLIDWQLMTRNLGAFDLAYFLCWSMTNEVRDAMRDRLIGLYHSELEANGINGYSREQLEDDVRTSVLGVSLMASLGRVTTPLVNERAQALADALVERTFSFIDDLSAWEMLPEPR